MRVPQVNIHALEQLLVHIIAVRMGVRGRQSDVFVEVKGPAQREVQPGLAMRAGEFVIHFFHGAAGGQSDDELGPGLQLAGDDTGNQSRSGGFGGTNDDFHLRRVFFCAFRNGE